MANQYVCQRHGGKSPAGLSAAAVRKVEHDARRLLQQRWADGLDGPVVDPLRELARIAGEIVAFKDYLRHQVSGLNGAISYWSETPILDDMPQSDEEAEERVKQAEELRAVVTAYERALDRSAKVLADMVKLDIAGRVLQVRRDEADIVVRSVREGLAAVDLEPAIREAVQVAIADRLAQVSAPVAVPHILSGTGPSV